MSGTPQKKFFIVVADDDIDDQHLIKEAFKETKLDYEITSVYNGLQLMDFLLRREVYSQIPAFKPDIILLDINMPILNGYGVIMQMKENEELADIPVYMLSTSSSALDKKAFKELGAQGYYTKPVKFQHLIAIVEEICEKSLE